jgi:hypothetical protein
VTVYYDDVAGTVRAVLAARRTPQEWAAIEPQLRLLRDAVSAGAEADIGAAEEALADLIDERRVAGFGDDLDLADDGVAPDAGLHELVNSLLSDLGFPEPEAGEEPEERR